ncbi:enoyl-CoA hydratase/isomerase family protein [Lysinibacillus sp. LZ02]|uniref:enoyl-CoA hydratase/isomerase family protein n=1 Tax=Lysinibacillus sp. LZ02 TaxID=3420668 RepID=UPI003D368848
MSKVLFEVQDHVAIITLNSPETGNAVGLEVAEEIFDIAIHCSENPDIRAVVITGAGPAFSVGGNLKSFAADAELGALIKKVTAYFHQTISFFKKMNKPLIGAINGVAAGGGMSLALACDLIYCSENARFVMAYNKIGFSPDGGGSYFLPRIVGLRRAFELLYTNRELTAEEAKEWGIVNQILPQQELLPFVVELAKQMAQGPMEAYGTTKQLLYHSFQESLDTQMALESNYLAARASSAEGREGVCAFLEKRQPRFIDAVMTD